MEAKEFLLQLQTLKKRIESKRGEIEQLKSIAYGITPQADGERVQSSGNPDRMGSAVVGYLQLETELSQSLAQYCRVMGEVIAVIEELKEPYYSIIHKRYVRNKSFAEIAAEEHYSYQYTTELHRNALKKVQKIINNQQNLVESFM
jgi:hypothetical protein